MGKHFRAATNGEASLFTFEYPETIVRRLVGQMLGRYLAWDETARIDATGLAARLVDQIREITGIEELLLVGDDSGLHCSWPTITRRRATSATASSLISPMELICPGRPRPGRRCGRPWK